MKYTALDIETTGLSFIKDRILGIGYGETYYTGAPPELRGPLVAHNAKFEHKFLQRAGYDFDIQFDTMLAASILINRPEKLTLDSLASYYLGVESWKSETNKLFKKKNWVQLLEASPALQKELADRNVADLKMTAALAPVLEAELHKEGMHQFFFEKLMPIARSLAEMEYRGMGIDVPLTEKTLQELRGRADILEAKLNAWAGAPINWNSPKQLMNLLKGKGYSLWGYDFKKRGLAESTSSDTLNRLLPNPNIELLLEHRATKKQISFLEGWLEDHIDGRLYASFNLASTRTFRLSSSGPNLQQVPRDKLIRQLFIPTPGKKFVIGDQAQVEVRVVAHYSQDEALLEVFKSNLDFYGSLAVRVLGVQCQPNDVKKLHPEMRRLAKVIGLSVLYGIGAHKLSSFLQKAGFNIDPDECKKIIKDYFRAYPGLLRFRQYVESKVLSGEILRTHYGRQFRIDPDKVFSTGVNTVVQSTASDACLFSQLEVDRRLKELGIDAPLIALVHDEVIREAAPEHAETVGKIMQEVMENQGFICPLKLDWAVGSNWGDKA